MPLHTLFLLSQTEAGHLQDVEKHDANKCGHCVIKSVKTQPKPKEGIKTLE